GDHVTKVDPDPKRDALVFNRFRIAVSHSPLHFYSAPHRIHHAREFRQEAVAGVLYGTATVLFDLWINQLTEMRLQPFVRPLLICPHQPRIAGDIGGEDCGEAAGRGHGWVGPLVESSVQLTVAQVRITRCAWSSRSEVSACDLTERVLNWLHDFSGVLLR